MAPRTIAHVGKVKIKLNGRDHVYYLAWPNPSGGKQLLESTGHRATNDRQRAGESIPTVVKDLARKKLDQLTQPATGHHGQPAGVSISEALGEGIKRGCEGREDRKKQVYDQGDYFADWLEQYRPHIRYWVQVTPAVVQDYIEYHHKRGLKSKTLQHYISPITITANWFHFHVDPWLYPELRVRSEYLKKTKPKKQYLALEPALALLKVADAAENRGVYHTILLGCFAGLNIMETIRLTQENFDHAEGVLVINESKNQFRERAIPLLPMVADKVKDFAQVRKTNGDPASLLSIVQAMRTVINRASKAYPVHAEAFNSINPKDVRKTFVNLCREAKITGENIGAYVGHRPVGTTNTAYNEIEAIEHLRKTVIRPLDRYLKKQLKQ